MKSKILIRKIALHNFITSLIEIYDDGADFIDIMGTTDPNQDEIGLMVREEYYSEEPTEDVEKLSEDELNQLI